MHAKTRGSLRTDDGEEDGVAGVGLPVHLRDPTQDGPERGHHLGLQTSTGNDTEEVLSAHIFCFRIFRIHTRRSCPGCMPQTSARSRKSAARKHGLWHSAGELTRPRFFGWGSPLPLPLPLLTSMLSSSAGTERMISSADKYLQQQQDHPAHMFRQRHGGVRVRACKRRGAAAAQGARAIGGRPGQHRR